MNIGELVSFLWTNPTESIVALQNQLIDMEIDPMGDDPLVLHILDLLYETLTSAHAYPNHSSTQPRLH